MAHTPTPWRVEENTDLIWGACNTDDTSSYGMGYPIVSGFASFGTWAAGRPDFNEKEANAAFIVRAVNAHDDLVEALKALRQCVIDAKGNFHVDDLKAQMALRLTNTALAKHGGQPAETSEVA